MSHCVLKTLRRSLTKGEGEEGGGGEYTDPVRPGWKQAGNSLETGWKQAGLSLETTLATDCPLLMLCRPISLRCSRSSAQLSRCSSRRCSRPDPATVPTLLLRSLCSLNAWSAFGWLYTEVCDTLLIRDAALCSVAKVGWSTELSPGTTQRAWPTCRTLNSSPSVN